MVALRYCFSRLVDELDLLGVGIFSVWWKRLRRMVGWALRASSRVLKMGMVGDSSTSFVSSLVAGDLLGSWTRD